MSVARQKRGDVIEQGCISYNMHSFTGIVPVVIPSKGAYSEGFGFVEEVGVLATVVVQGRRRK